MLSPQFAPNDYHGASSPSIILNSQVCLSRSRMELTRVRVEEWSFYATYYKTNTGTTLTRVPPQARTYPLGFQRSHIEDEKLSCYGTTSRIVLIASYLTWLLYTSLSKAIFQQAQCHNFLNAPNLNHSAVGGNVVCVLCLLVRSKANPYILDRLCEVAAPSTLQPPRHT